jgi:hypothetical protein
MQRYPVPDLRSTSDNAPGDALSADAMSSQAGVRLTACTAIVLPTGVFPNGNDSKDTALQTELSTDGIYSQ